MPRDPKKHPAPGDILTRFGSTRTVTSIETNTHGTLSAVVYNDTQRSTISAWRSWSRQDCRIISIAPA